MKGLIRKFSGIVITSAAHVQFVYESRKMGMSPITKDSNHVIWQSFKKYFVCTLQSSIIMFTELYCSQLVRIQMEVIIKNSSHKTIKHSHGSCMLVMAKQTSLPPQCFGVFSRSISPIVLFLHTTNTPECICSSTNRLSIRNTYSSGNFDVLVKCQLRDDDH